MSDTALSIRQPWAWLILHAGKDIENRNWRTLFRGRVLIHASQGMTNDEYFVGYEAWRRFARIDGNRFPAKSQLERGGIVGEAEIVDCVTSHPSPWFVGQYGFILRNPKVLPFVPCKGRLGFFKV